MVYLVGDACLLPIVIDSGVRGKEYYEFERKLHGTRSVQHSPLRVVHPTAPRCPPPSPPKPAPYVQGNRYHQLTFNVPFSQGLLSHASCDATGAVTSNMLKALIDAKRANTTDSTTTATAATADAPAPGPMPSPSAVHSPPPPNAASARGQGLALSLVCLATAIAFLMG